MNVEKILHSQKDHVKDEQQKSRRNKTILILIHEFLNDNGLMFTADTLKSEVNFSIDDFNVCDNIQLESILQDFETYYFLKYQKSPHIIKKSDNSSTSNTNCNRFPASSSAKLRASARSLTRCKDKQTLHSVDDFSKCNLNSSLSSDSNYLSNVFESRSLEWKALAATVIQDISKDNIFDFSSVTGLENAKQSLKEAAIYPLKYPHLFISSLQWKSVLLYGPAGTGKTMLANAAAAESGSTLFRLSASTIISKWRGESEKLVNVCFELALHQSPSIIFIDEIDTFLRIREGDHEASRRMKTEFFLQLDKLALCNKQVLIVAATNVPWDLDCAVLRRMEKRIFVGLPDFQNRVDLFKRHLPSTTSITEKISFKSTLNYTDLSVNSEGYSAADIVIVCKEVKMNLVRNLCKLFDDQRNTNLHFDNVTNDDNTIRTDDVVEALKRIKPISCNFVGKYLEWKDKYGSE